MQITLGERLRTLRMTHGLKQSVICEEVGMSQSNLSKIERDILHPSLQQLILFCKCFHCSLAELLKYTAYEEIIFSNNREEITSQSIVETIQDLQKQINELKAFHNQ